MSIHDSHNFNTTNNNSLNQNRFDYSDKFQEHINNIKQLGQSHNQPITRWNQLYISSKIKKIKDENIRKQTMEKRENDMLSECTFQPQLTKTPKYLKYNGLLTYQSENTSNKEDNLTITLMDQRTKIWMNKKADKLKLIKENENYKALNECCFRPKIVCINNIIYVYRIQVLKNVSMVKMQKIY
jgi:hypothetical protein